MRDTLHYLHCRLQKTGIILFGTLKLRSMPWGSLLHEYISCSSCTQNVRIPNGSRSDHGGVADVITCLKAIKYPVFLSGVLFAAQ